ncbi:MAG: HEAT repeat domain-containing protein, partial [Planctomycetota bacterium]
MKLISAKRVELTILGILVTALSLLPHFGCATIKKTIDADTPETKPADTELRRKLEEWTSLLHSPDPTIRSSAAVSLLGINLLNAQEPLVKILMDRKEREDVKISVIKAFGFTKDDRATDVLIALLDSESVFLQSAAAEALGGLRTKKSMHTMSEAMLAPRQSLTTKILLAKALGNTNDRETVEPLIKMLAVDDPGLRQAAKKSLEKVTKQAADNDSAWWKDWWNRNKSKTREQWLEDIVLKQEENTRQLEAKLEQLRLEVSQKSIKLLETRTDKSEPKVLMDALKSGYPDVRIFAAKELAKIKEPSVIDALIEAALDTQEEVRIDVVQRLGEIGDERAVRPLINALDDESLVVREKAAMALGLLRKPEATEPLISTLSSNTNLLITCAIIDALGQIGETKAVDPLLTFLSHPESKIRECAAASLGGIRNARAIEPLIAALSDEQERVRWYAADSLGK